MAHSFASTNHLALVLLFSVCVVSCAAFAGHLGISMGVTTKTPARRRSPRKASGTPSSAQRVGTDSPAKKSPARTKTEKSPTRKSKKSPARKTKKKAKDPETKIFAFDLARIVPENEWTDLNVAPEELRPSNCLTTGQAFSWLVVESDDEAAKASMAIKQSLDVDFKMEQQQQQSASAWGVHDAKEWVGPLGDRVISIRETPATTLYRVLHGKTDGVVEYLRDYFQLDTPLVPLYEQWGKCDVRLRRIAEVIPGVRILRQNPVECLFSFICSSNNNVPRITQLLASFRKTYGQHLVDLPCRSDGAAAITWRKVYSFPKLEALQAATDQGLRDMGFGYRAPYIVETRDLLQELGGHEYLISLRAIKDADQVQEKLIEFKGVGRKVADCVALFSLDQMEAIPVDTHVWHIACREYDPSLSDVKSLTPTVYRRVGDLFQERFVSHAGWAHSLLFVAELPSFRSILPEDIVAQMNDWREQEQEKKAADKEEKKKAKKAAK